MKHVIRTKDYQETGKVKHVDITRSQAIKIMCTECLGYEDHPKDCTSTMCPLFPFRGKTQMAFHGGKVPDD